MDAILEVRNLTKRFQGLLAINHVSFMLERNEILGLIGPNGAGKTTMISLISGTLEPTEGEVLFEGTPEAVDAMVDWCRRGPAFAQVDDVDTRPVAPSGARTFSVR